MIPSYNEELRIRRNKDRIFWVVVFLMTVFLFFFFQGYYPNYERFLGLEKENISKETFMKPFGIIDVHVFPGPDSILINNEPYSNNSKTIFDLGEYMVSINKAGYLPITFPLAITQDNRFYTNTVNLFPLPEYSQAPFNAKRIFSGTDFALVESVTPGDFWITSPTWDILQKIQTAYTPIGGLYFTDRSNIFVYSRDTTKFTALISPDTKLPYVCKKVSYYDWKLFCHDTMKFFGPKIPDIKEKILSINDQIITTSKYIYNQESSNATWKYFEYQTGSLKNPRALVHIRELPYIFEGGIFSALDSDASGSLLLSRDFGFDAIHSTKEFGSELILIGEKNEKGRFLLMEGLKRYAGTFDIGDTSDMQVSRLNSAYIFQTKHQVYIYYKGAKEVIKILDNVDIIDMIGAEIFFSKEGKTYMIDLLRKEK